MRALPLALAAAVLLAACSGSAGRPPGRASTPLPAGAPALVPPPAEAVLTAAEVGLPLTSGRDEVSAAEAAATEPDQADALAIFESWGWVAESTRGFGAGGSSVAERVLLLLKPEGAAEAYAYLAQAAETAPMTAGLCPASVAGLDQCVAGSAGGRTVVAGRRGTEVFELTVVGVDPGPLAALQARRLRL